MSCGAVSLMHMRGRWEEARATPSLARMPRHELVGVDPSRQCRDGGKPSLDVRIVGPGDADFLRPVQISAQRNIGDRGSITNREIMCGKMLLEHGERGLTAGAQELGDRRLRAFHE